MRFRHSQGGLVLLALIAAVGCSPHEVRKDPMPALEAPAGFVASESGGAAAVEMDRWWEAFGDPQLDAIVDQTLEGNLELQASWLRLQQAESVAEQQGARFWPQVSLEAQRSVTRTDIRDLTSTTTHNWQVSIPASFELDLWGRLSSNAKAAELDASAARDDVSTIAISLSAQATEQWFGVLELRERKRLLQEQIEISRRWLELLEARFAWGRASSLDVLQQREQIQGLEAQVLLIEAQEESALLRLTVLSGKLPGQASFGGAERLPALPPLPATGVPADLLERRPDLRAARKRVEAADHRVAAAVADWLPTLRLGGNLLVSAMSLSELFDLLISTAFVSLGVPIFDGGNRSANIERLESVVRAQLLSYTQTFLTAVQDVESALLLERQQQANVEALERQLEISRSTLEAARLRYRDGGEDFLRVLVALQAVQRNEQAVLSARRQLLSYRIQLHRALGGSWPESLERPDAQAEESR